MRRTTSAIVWLALLALLVAVFAAPTCGDDDDDDNQSKEDGDGNGGDDDDSVGDDDAADDNPPGDFFCDGEICTDSSSGLIWQNVSDTFSDWEDAKDYCDELVLGGREDWRLPSVSELRTLVRGCDATATGGDCAVTAECLDFDCRNEMCQGCDYYNGPGSDGRYWPPKLVDGHVWYWSSSAVSDHVNYAWYVEFNGASINNRDVWTLGDVRCVR